MTGSEVGALRTQVLLDQFHDLARSWLITATDNSETLSDGKRETRRQVWLKVVDVDRDADK
jgi:hypothetical protein